MSTKILNQKELSVSVLLFLLNSHALFISLLSVTFLKNLSDQQFLLASVHKQNKKE